MKRGPRNGDAVQGLSAIAHVHIESLRTTYCDIIAEEFLDAMSADTRIDGWLEILKCIDQMAFVALDANKNVVGFANAGPERMVRTDFCGEVSAIYLLPDARGLQTGRRLVAETVNWLRDRNLESHIVWECTTIRIADQDLIELAYGWEDIEDLVGKTL